MSALRLKADLLSVGINVRQVPEAVVRPHSLADRNGG
jgi:hypothetical protein